MGASCEKNQKKEIKLRYVKRKNMNQNKIKIIHIIHTLGIGGGEMFMVDLINNLDRNKFDPRIVLLEKNLELKDRLKGDVPIFIAGRNTKLGLGSA